MQINEPQIFEQKIKNLQNGQNTWLLGELSDSYENKIFSLLNLPIRGRTFEEYLHLFQEFGLELEYIEIKRQIRQFRSFEELREWVETQVEDSSLVEPYLLAMKQIGYIKLQDGSVAFPTKYMIACIKKVF